MATPTHLPAAPLAALIDRMCAQEGDSKAVFARLKVNQRKVYDWRHRPNANVDFDRADRVLSASPYLWFDVWPECEEHARPLPGCETCHGHVYARRTFTGERLPYGFGEGRKA